MGKRKADPNEKVSILTLIDMSGSMMHHRKEVINGWNNHLKTLRKKFKGFTNIKVSLTFFDSQETKLVYNVPLAEAREITEDDYEPRMWTPLYDAMGGMLARKPAEADRVLVVVITDGLENASKEYTYDRLKALIDRREKEGWSFLYLSNNPIAKQQGAGLTGQASLSDYGKLPGQMFSNMRGKTVSIIDYMESGMRGSAGTTVLSTSHTTGYAEAEKERKKAAK